MRLEPLATLAAMLGLGSAGALAQSGDLSGVTMRVLDDLRGVDAVVLELGPNRGADEEGAQSERSASEGRDQDGRRDSAPPDEASEGEQREPGRERDALRDVEEHERSEDRLEDRDVERPAAVP